MLNACGFECLIDRHDISDGEDWKRRLGRLISEVDTVVFVLSPTRASAFEKARQKLLATRTEAHFELWRQDCDFHAWKDRMHDERLPMPPRRTDGIARCFCGAEIINASLPQHIQMAHRGIGEGS